MAYAVTKENKALIDALNSGLDAVIADGTWARLNNEWLPRAPPADWKAGLFKAATTPESCPTRAITAVIGPPGHVRRRNRLWHN